MISKIASKVVEKFLDSYIVDNAEKELYLYGFFVLISQILYLILTITFGFLLSVVFESIIFYVAFQLIRRYAGGIHASSELKCEIATTASIFLCLLSIKLCEINKVQIPILILTILAAVSIFIFCPLDTPEKPISKNEYKYFRKITWMVLTIMLMVIAVLIINKSHFAYPVCLSIILESLLLIAGKIKRKCFNEKGEQ